MTSRSVVATCRICKEKYFEPDPKTLKLCRCGHCRLIRSWAQDGTEESAREADEFRRQQRARNIALRPRVSEVLSNLDDE